jgi:polar amino acid transport system substrate-binding protein
MRPLLSLLTLCLLLPALAARAEPVDLRVITEKSPPSSFHVDGELTGVSVELVREIMRRSGVGAPIEVMPWARGYLMASEIPNIALFATTRLPEREPLFHWVGPLLRLKWVFYGRAGDAPPIDSLDDARSLTRIGTYHNDAREQFLIKNGFTNLESVNAQDINLRKLMAGRIDVVASSNLGEAAWIRAGIVNPGDLEEIFVIRQADLYVAFSLQTDPAIIRSWRAALASMHEDGTFADIHARWLPGQQPPLEPLHAY